MPREYGQLRHDMWSDDDWLNLTVGAQHLYMTLLGDAGLNYAGVTDWRPGKIAQRAHENSPADTIIAAQELSDAFFLVIDEESEEVLLRSYLRHDPILKNPRLAVTMSKDYATIGSRKIRAALVHELQRLRKEKPDLAAWDKPTVKTILRQSAVSAKEMVTELPQGAALYLPNLLGNVLPTDLPRALRNRDNGFTSALQRETATTTSTATSSIEDALDRGSSYPHVETSMS